MKTKLFFTGLALIAMIAVSNAQNGNGNGQRQGQGQGIGQGQGYNQDLGYGQNSGYFCNNIPGITEEQKSKMEELRIAQWKTKQANQNLIREKKAHLITLQSAEIADTKAINTTIDEVTTLQNKQWKSRSAHILEVRNLLTDDQKVYFNAHQSKKGQGFRQGKGNRNGQGNRCSQGNRGRGNGNYRYN